MAEKIINVTDIMKMLPHRYPMLLVDRVIDIEGDQSITALKNVTMNEDMFNGHFPGEPVMPGVLIVEAMAQTSALLVVDSSGEAMAGKIVYFMAIDGAKFRKPVVPGDQLKIHAEKVQGRRNVFKFKCEARVDGALCAEATVTAMVMDEKKA